MHLAAAMRPVSVKSLHTVRLMVFLIAEVWPRQIVFTLR